MKLDEPFSLRAEEQRQQQRSGRKAKRTRKQRRGRTKTADKIIQAVRTETVYPREVPSEACWHSHTRAVWRLEKGQAVRVAYR